MEAARRELERVARLIVEGDTDLACSRAYYAAFYAVQEALAVVGEIPKTHAGTHRQFGVIAQAGGALDDPEAGRLFRRLEEWRIRVDYARDRPGPEVAQEMLRGAEHVVAAVERFVERTRDQGGGTTPDAG
ncbi:MAG: HEPN domain-containing protein [Acidimicrobiia bacterium]